MPSKAARVAFLLVLLAVTAMWCDAGGHATVPAGLAEPDLVPRFPQRMAELMVGEVPLGPAGGRLPASAAEVGVGPVTAAEVGWLPPATRPDGGR
jgi:hypothetical protein